MKKTYIKPVTESVTAEAIEFVCNSNVANWGDGKFDNEGDEKDSNIDDSDSDIDAQSKEFDSLWW